MTSVKVHIISAILFVAICIVIFSTLSLMKRELREARPLIERESFSATVGKKAH